MSRISEPTAEQETSWKEWVAERPDTVRAVAERFDPWSLYRMKSTGQRVTLHSIFEDGTVSVNISADYNFVLHERNVFGIDPNDLEPCEIPPPDEFVGSVLTSYQVEENIDVLRVLIFPDLFVMGDDGTAKRKQ